MPALPLLDNFFATLDSIIEFERKFSEKIDNIELVNQQIISYIEKNELTNHNIGKKISDIKNNINDHKSNPIMLKALISELVLLIKLQENQLDESKIESEIKTTFLKAQFNIFIKNYIGSIKNKEISYNSSLQNSIPTLAELMDDTQSEQQSLDENEKIDIFNQNIKNHYLEFDFDENGCGELYKILEKIGNGMENFKSQFAKNITLFTFISETILKHPIDFGKNMKKFSKGSILSSQNIEIIFSYVNIIKKIFVEAHNKTVEECNSKLKKQQFSIISEKKEPEQLFKIISGKLKNFSKDICIFDKSALPIDPLQNLIENVIQYNQKAIKNKENIINSIIENIGKLCLVVSKNFIIPKVLSLLGNSKNPQEIAGTLYKNNNINISGLLSQDSQQTLNVNETEKSNNEINHLLCENEALTITNNALKKTIGILKNESTKTNDQITKFKKQNTTLKDSNKQLKLLEQQNTFKIKSLEKENALLREKLLKLENERNNLKSQKSDDSGIENEEQNHHIIKKVTLENTEFTESILVGFKKNILGKLKNDIDANKDTLNDFGAKLNEFDEELKLLSDKRNADISNLRKINFELHNEIERLKLENSKTSNEKTDKIIILTNKLLDAIKTIKQLKSELENEKNIPKINNESSIEKKLSILEKVLEFFSKLFKTISNSISSICKKVSSSFLYKDIKHGTILESVNK
jgi:hypothetical protein